MVDVSSECEESEEEREEKQGLPGQRGRSLEGVVDELGNVRMERTTVPV